MSYRLPPTLPSAFERLDATATAKGRPVDVRTMQTLSNNHNMLIARRFMRNVLHRNLRESPTVPPYFRGFLRQTAPGVFGSEIMRGPLLVSPHCRLLKVVVHAEYTYVTSRIYGVLQPHGMNRDVSTTYGANVTAATETEYSFDLPVPRQQGASSGWAASVYDFALYVEAGIGSSSKTGTTDTVLFNGPNWIYGSFAAGDIGKIIVVTGDAEIEPRMIVDVDVPSSGSQRAFVSPPWNKIPGLGLTYDVRNAGGVGVYDVSVYEQGMTSTFPQLAGGL